jgi:hypothetical protein
MQQVIRTSSWFPCETKSAFIELTLFTSGSCSHQEADFILKTTNQLLFIRKIDHNQKILYHANGDLTCYPLIEEVGVDMIKHEEL